MACTFEPPPPDGTPEPPVIYPPVIDSVGSAQVRVSERLEFAGEGFIAPELGQVEVGFTGTFDHPGGTVQASATLVAQATAEDRIQAAFGPFDIPFTSAGNVIGRFRGRVFATNRAFDGRSERQDESTWIEVELEVLPSIVLVVLEPKILRLDLPPPHALADTPYRLMIRSAGFAMASIEYRLGAGALIDGRPVDLVIHDAIGDTDTLGDRELLTFTLADEDDDQVVPIVIQAASGAGETHVFTLNAIVHRTPEIRTGG